MGWQQPPFDQAAGWQAPMNPADEVEMLREEAKAVKRDLEAINQRIDEIEKGSSEPS